MSNELEPMTDQQLSALSTNLSQVGSIAMQAHTSATTNSAELRVHREECAATRLRNEAMFSNITQNIRGLDDKITDKLGEVTEKLEERHEELKKDINASNKWIYMIVGGITLAGALFGKVNLHSLTGG